MPEKVAIIGTTYPAYERSCPNWIGMKDGLTRLGIEHVFFSCRPTLSIDEIVQYNPDFLIYGLLDMVRQQNWREELRVRLPKAKIVFWYGDYRDHRTGVVTADLSEIDAMFVSNDAQEDFYKDRWKVRNCHFLPLGSPLWAKRYNPAHDFEFVFIGAILATQGFGARAHEIVEFKRRGLKVINGIGSEARRKVFMMMPSIYSSSEIVLDQSHFTDVLRYTSNRFWIITAAGGFALTKRWPGCEEFYPEGTRVYFDTFEQALELKDYYLAHKEERDLIAAAGHEHAKLHTYDHRFRKMFEVVYGA